MDEKLGGTSIVCSGCMQLVRVDLIRERESNLASMRLWHYKGRCRKCELNVYLSFMKIAEDEWKELKKKLYNKLNENDEEV